MRRKLTPRRCPKVLGYRNTVWRATLGQVGEGLTSDGNGDLIVDQLDYDYWKARFGTVGEPVSGDYNGNGVVDAAHYILWRDTLAQPPILPLRADGNGNGVVDQVDYELWKRQFGVAVGRGSGASQNATVPEPATAVILVLTMADWCLRRRRAASKVPATPQRVTLVDNGPIRHSRRAAIRLL